jgi:V/A-type H+-transporting ATPase subunit I
VTFLKPVDMVKVGVVGLKDDQETVVTTLHDLRVVQVETVSKETLEVLEPERASETARAVGDQLIRFRGLKSALPARPTTAPRRFDSLQQVMDATRTISIDDDVGEFKREEDAALTERKTTLDTLSLLERFSFFRDRLEYLTGAHVLAFFGEAKPAVYEGLKVGIPALSDAQFFENPTPELVRFIVVVRTDQAEAIGRLAQQKGVALTAAPRLTGTIAAALPELRQRLEGVDARLSTVRAGLAGIADTWYAPVAALEEALTIEARKLDIYTKLGAGATTFALEGWVPKRSRAALQSTLERATNGRAHFYDAPAHDEPPTLLDNPKGVRWYEFFIRFYSIPQSNEWDPTWIFAIAFTIFFGFMLGDWGFGLVILLVSLWMIAGFPGGQRLPNGPKNFVKLIMGPDAMRQLAYALIPGCLVAIGFGLYADSFFGATPFLWYYGYEGFSFQHHVALLLGISVIFGMGMVGLGFLLGAIHEYYRHHRRALLGKVGGLVAAVGIAGLFGPILSAGTGIFPTGAAASTIFVLLFALGATLLIVGEGIQMGAIGALENLSHVLSYARLVGILLASAVLAGLVDTFAHGLLFTTGVWAVAGILGGLLLLVFGLGFSVILGVFEPGIQGARLIFVEHFSKYYEGNGRPFAPFGSRREHTLPANPP